MENFRGEPSNFTCIRSVKNAREFQDSVIPSRYVTLGLQKNGELRQRKPEELLSFNMFVFSRKFKIKSLPFGTENHHYWSRGLSK